MAEYHQAFFHNVTTQRPDRTSSKPRNNVSVLSQAQPIRATFTKKKRKSSRDSSSTSTSTTTTTINRVEGASSLSLSETSRNHSPQSSQTQKSLFGTTTSSTQNKSAISLGAQNTTHHHHISSHNISSQLARNHAPAAEQYSQRLDIINARSESISSMSGTGSSSLTAITTGEKISFEAIPSSFTRRHGRRYLRDTSLPYPLPCDISELHRQTLRTMLFCQAFDGPICSPLFKHEPPKKVLDFACGTGYWSAMCHQHYTKLGFPPISFTGLDIAPLAPNMNKEDGMKWNFVQSDFRKPLPFSDNTFDFVMSKDLATAIPLTTLRQFVIDELIRVVRPGGVFEIWDGDISIRMLLPHTPDTKSSNDSEDRNELQKLANTTGTYIVTTQTPFATPQNQYLTDYNNWVAKVFDQRKLTVFPCTLIRSDVLQEESLNNIGFRRLAIPLSEVRWEREGVGGYVKLGPDGQARISAKGKAREVDKKVLTAGQAALRRTALQTVVQMIESLEPLLREVSGKGQDEWDRWWGNMMNDLMNNNGTSWGECVEIGAWYATKRTDLA